MNNSFENRIMELKKLQKENCKNKQLDAKQRKRLIHQRILEKGPYHEPKVKNPANVDIIDVGMFSEVTLHLPPLAPSFVSMEANHS